MDWSLSSGYVSVVVTVKATYFLDKTARVKDLPSSGFGQVKKMEFIRAQFAETRSLARRKLSVGTAGKSKVRDLRLKKERYQPAGGSQLFPR